MENDISLAHKFAKNVGACNTLWYYSQEKMGGKLRFHGFICFCSCGNLLGNMGSQDVLWLEAPFYQGFSVSLGKTHLVFFMILKKCVDLVTLS